MDTKKQIDICMSCPYDECKGSCDLIRRSRLDGLQEKANKMDRKARREFYLEHKICPYCGRRRLTPGYTTCTECRARHNKYSYERYWSKKGSKCE